MAQFLVCLFMDMVFVSVLTDKMRGLKKLLKNTIERWKHNTLPRHSSVNVLLQVIGLCVKSSTCRNHIHSYVHDLHV